MANDKSTSQTKIIANIRQQQPFHGEKSDIEPIQTYTYKAHPSQVSFSKRSPRSKASSVLSQGKVASGNMQRTLREYRDDKFNRDYLSRSPRTKFISENESGMILNGVELQLDGSKGDLTNRSRVKQSPTGQTKFYTQSNRFYSQKRGSHNPQLPKYLNKPTVDVKELLDRANKATKQPTGQAGAGPNSDIRVHDGAVGESSEPHMSQKSPFSI